MPASKRLSTGPYGAAVRDRVLAESRGDESGLWIVPTELARVQVRTALAKVSGANRGHRVWCWDSLWQAIRDANDDGPWPLGEAGSRSALGVAIDRAFAAGRLSPESLL